MSSSVSLKVDVDVDICNVTVGDKEVEFCVDTDWNRGIIIQLDGDSTLGALVEYYGVYELMSRLQDW